MASTSTLIVLFTLLSTISLFPCTSADDNPLGPILSPIIGDNPLAPILSPIVGSICKGDVCGKGKCKPPQNNDLLYECECDPGWKQGLASNGSSPLKFLPCVIPNCTLDFSCSEAASPAQSKETPRNTSIFETCSWANCGGGVCNKTSAFAYTCECKEGYYNLFNNTAFPCFKECSIGGDCTNLGITMTNKSTAPSPSLPDKSSTQAYMLQLDVFYGMIMLVLAGALIL